MWVCVFTVGIVDGSVKCQCSLTLVARPPQRNESLVWKRLHSMNGVKTARSSVERLYVAWHDSDFLEITTTENFIFEFFQKREKKTFFKKNEPQGKPCCVFVASVSFSLLLRQLEVLDKPKFKKIALFFEQTFFFKNTLQFIHWMLTSKGMHSMNGNIKCAYSNCKKENANLMCFNCKDPLQIYCSRDCQKKDHSNHMCVGETKLNCLHCKVQTNNKLKCFKCEAAYFCNPNCRAASKHDNDSACESMPSDFEQNQLMLKPLIHLNETEMTAISKYRLITDRELRRCTNCLTIANENLPCCTTCDTTPYCNEQCRKHDEKNHRSVCQHGFALQPGLGQPPRKEFLEQDSLFRAVKKNIKNKKLLNLVQWNINGFEADKLIAFLDIYKDSSFILLQELRVIENSEEQEMITSILNTFGFTPTFDLFTQDELNRDADNYNLALAKKNHGQAIDKQKGTKPKSGLLIAVNDKFVAENPGYKTDLLKKSKTKRCMRIILQNNISIINAYGPADKDESLYIPKAHIMNNSYSNMTPKTFIHVIVKTEFVTKNTIVMGDVNSRFIDKHSELKLSSTEKKFEAEILNCNMSDVASNIWPKTHSIPPTRPDSGNTIDRAFVSNNLISRLQFMTFDTNVYGSDHVPISIGLTLDEPKPEEFEQTRSSIRLKPEQISPFISSSWNPSIDGTHNEILNAIQRFTKNLLEKAINAALEPKELTIEENRFDVKAYNQKAALSSLITISKKSLKQIQLKTTNSGVITTGWEKTGIFQIREKILKEKILLTNQAFFNYNRFTIDPTKVDEQPNAFPILNRKENIQSVDSMQALAQWVVHANTVKADLKIHIKNHRKEMKEKAIQTWMNDHHQLQTENESKFYKQLLKKFDKIEIGKIARKKNQNFEYPSIRDTLKAQHQKKQTLQQRLKQ